MRVPPSRTIKVGDRGEDVRRLQVALGDRARARGMKAPHVDGEYGPETARSYYDIGAALGLLRATLLKGPTRGAQRVIRSPKTRTPAMLARAVGRRVAARRKPLRLRAFERAKAYLAEGVAEVGGNNVGARVVAIIREAGGVPGEPWCGDFVAACYIEAGSKLVRRWWASTIALLANLLKVTHPLQGHIVIYDFGTPGAKHTGEFDEWIVPGDTFWAIEGNTGAQGAVSDSSGGGDGVHRRRRSVDQVAGWRRINA